MYRLQNAIEELAARYLGHFGIVSVADSHSAAGHGITVYSTDPDTARFHLPTLHHGFTVLVRHSGPLAPHGS